jgi:catechol 2,3-dioxygenase-like lactoylglutathione lyase family enzyme
MKIANLDHIVLTVQDIDRTVEFYTRVLGMKVKTFGPNQSRIGLTFGSQQINLHQVGTDINPLAGRPTPGSGDFCLIAETPIAEVVRELKEHGVDIELGPVQRSGALGMMESVYFRDPDGNLVEVANYPG